MSFSMLTDNKIVSFGGTLSATSEDTTYPVNNVKNYNAASVFRTVDVGGVYYLVHDFGSATNVNATALATVNFATDADIRVQASTTSNFAVLNVDEAINVTQLNSRDRFNLYHKMAQAFVFRYWRIQLDPGSIADPYFEVGEWFLGLHTTLASTQNFELPFTLNYLDGNVLHQTEYNQDYAYIRDLQAQRSMTLEWRGVTTQTKNSLKNAILDSKMSGKPFFICPDDTATGPEGFFVRAIGEMDISQEKGTLWHLRLNFIELARGLRLPSVD